MKRCGQVVRPGGLVRVEAAYGNRAERGELAFALIRSGAFNDLTCSIAWLDPVVRRALLPIAPLLMGIREGQSPSVSVVRELEASWIEAVADTEASSRTDRRDFMERVERLSTRLADLAAKVALCPGWRCSSPLIHPSLAEHARFVEFYGAGRGVHKVHVPSGCAFPFPALNIPPQPVWLAGTSARDRLHERLHGALDVVQRLAPPLGNCASTTRDVLRLASTTRSLLLARCRDMASVITQEAQRLGLAQAIDDADESFSLNRVDWDAEDGLHSADPACLGTGARRRRRFRLTFEQERAGVFAYCSSAQPIVYSTPDMPEHARIAALLSHVSEILRTVRPVVDYSMCRDLPGSVESFGMADFKDHADAWRREAIYTTQNSQCCSSSLEELKAALYPPCKNCIARLANSPWFELERA
jgi:hypothetical protein